MGWGRRLAEAALQDRPEPSKKSTVTGSVALHLPEHVGNFSGTSLAHVHHQRGTAHRLSPPLDQVPEGWDEQDGEVVHGEEADVLEAVRGQRLPEPERPVTMTSRSTLGLPVARLPRLQGLAIVVLFRSAVPQPLARRRASSRAGW
jgi:hypothetical protein